MNPVEDLVALSKWIDAGNAHRDPEAVTWGRLAKISEECGEVIEAYIGATGQNPRKGVTKTMADVESELLDVALTALAALEHIRDHDGQSLALLQRAIFKVAARAGVAHGQRHSKPSEEAVEAQQYADTVARNRTAGEALEVRKRALAQYHSRLSDAPLVGVSEPAAGGLIGVQGQGFKVAGGSGE